MAQSKVTWGESALSQPSVLVDALLAVTIAALFSGLGRHVGPVKVQLADVLSAASILLIALRGFAMPRVSGVLLLMLGAFLMLFSMSALSVGTANGAKEIVQCALVFSFIFAVFGYYRTRPTDRLLKFSAVLIGAILVYNVVWHVSHGHYVGWKQLNEPKTVFTILPLLLILLADRSPGGRRRLALACAALLAGLVIVLSGERKAYIFGAVALLVWTAPINWRHVVAVLVLAPLLLAVASVDQTGYLDKQFASVTDAFGDKGPQSASLASLMDDSRPATMSDAQRELSNRLAAAMWEKSPVLGIGTNAFTEYIEEQSSIPARFRLNVHGEFYRTLFENGVVGLALYVSLWAVAFTHIALAWRGTKTQGDANLNRLKLLCAAMLLIYCMFEASKGLTTACICLLPFIAAIPPRTRPRRSLSWRHADAV